MSIATSPAKSSENQTYGPDLGRRGLRVWQRPLVGSCGPLIAIDRYPENGFTLTELIIVLAIAAILLALAMPGMGAFVQNNRLVSQANDLVADLSVARSEAIRRGRRVVVCASSNPAAATPGCDTTGNAWTGGRLVFVDNTDPYDNAYSVTDGDVLLRMRESLEGRANTAFASGPDALRVAFENSGLTTMQAGQETRFALCDERGESAGQLVVLSFTGRASSGGNPTNCRTP